MKLQLIVLPLLAIGILACSKQTPDSTNGQPASQVIQNDVKSEELTPQTVIGDNSQNALDWPGRYSGILPCASCEGIKTILILYKDNTYKLDTQYLGEDEHLFTETGKLQWDKTGAKISLKPVNQKGVDTQYLVGENRLFMLDRQGQRITGTLANNYRLTKE
ncbi:copper resistance protein NlpE [Shewanella sp. D64]|nr:MULTISPECIES: copper resistance protein NlpE [unclassified Shewanella]MEC4725017.1 copper resistance protein NlpE [Shewanella sp. D64]MEC4736918.1 copper resistance protein NlpE [Shewanella sp. E94]